MVKERVTITEQDSFCEAAQCSAGPIEWDQRSDSPLTFPWPTSVRRRLSQASQMPCPSHPDPRRLQQLEMARHTFLSLPVATHRGHVGLHSFCPRLHKHTRAMLVNRDCPALFAVRI